MRIEFKAPWPLPDGMLTLSAFILEAGPTGWKLYKKTSGGEDWFEVPSSSVTQIGQQNKIQLLISY